MRSFLMAFVFIGSASIVAGNIEKYDIKVEAKRDNLVISARFTREMPAYFLQAAADRVLIAKIGTRDHRTDDQNVKTYSASQPQNRLEIVDGIPKIIIGPSRSVLQYHGFFDAKPIRDAKLSEADWILSFKTELDK